MLTSADEEPAEPVAALCQSTAMEISHGQRRASASEKSFIAVACSEMTPMTLSLIGLRSWS